MRSIYIILALAFTLSHSADFLRPLDTPQSYLLAGTKGVLRDDVYSLDAVLVGEWSFCNCFSVYGDLSYRFFSYEFDTMFHDQRHEKIDLQVNGFNETYLGMKLMPYPFFGVDVSWRLPPGEGSQVNRFHRLGISPMGVYAFSRGLTLGAAAEYLTFLEDDNFQPGDEIGLKGSLSWRLAWNHELRKGWQVDYVFLYRWRIQESKNLNMDKDYQDMDDLYRGFRMRVDMARYFAVFSRSLGVALFYEMNRGYLFGFETGHTLGLYTKFVF